MSPQQADSPVGFVAIDKAPGWTSHDVVAKVRKLTGVRRVGHAGTLDPFATGLVIVAVGQATRLLQYAQETSKQYRATLRLGMQTDTLDTEGGVTKRADRSTWPDEGYVRSVVAGFSGAMRQVPPSYSAIHIRGKRAYELARSGEEVELPAREVTVHAISVKTYSPPLLDIDLECSTGTYVRSLARDIGRELGTLAYCHSLRRVGSGVFSIDEAVKIQDLDRRTILENWSVIAQPVDIVVESFPSIEITKSQCSGWYHGQSLAGFAGCPESVFPVRVYDPAGRFVGLGRLDPVAGLLPKIVFAP